MRWLLLAYLLAASECAKLIKVVILARHGNRAPNIQIPYLCPVYAEHVLDGFNVPLAQLTRVGAAENWESGLFLRNKYIPDFLPERFVPDGSVTFFAERMTRNVVSTQIVTQGMYPDGSGPDGYLPSRPNVVPVSTSQEGKDELMNCPRDGPCRHRFRQDFEQWAAEHDPEVYASNAALLEHVSKVCGNEHILDPNGILYQGKKKSLTWGLKAISDAFSFAANEGLDATMGGRISLADLAAFKAVAAGVINGTRFGHPHQLTYWVSNFLPNLFLIATRPTDPMKLEVWHTEKFHLFLNHRELIYSIAHILGMPIAFPNMPLDTLPAGCFLGFEIYEMEDGSTGLKFYWWGPTRPDGELKMSTLNKTGSLLSLYEGGVNISVAPVGCSVDEPCPLDHVQKLFTAWTAQTGTYHKLCKIPPFKSFRKSEQWHDPSDGPASVPKPKPVHTLILARSGVTFDQSSLLMIPVIFCIFAVVARLFLSYQAKLARPLV